MGDAVFQLVIPFRKVGGEKIRQSEAKNRNLFRIFVFKSGFRLRLPGIIIDGFCPCEGAEWMRNLLKDKPNTIQTDNNENNRREMGNGGTLLAAGCVNGSS